MRALRLSATWPWRSCFLAAGGCRRARNAGPAADVTVECLPAVNVPIVNPSSLFVDDRDWI